jgi:hypothetical protein
MSETMPNDAKCYNFLKKKSLEKRIELTRRVHLEKTSTNTAHAT